jgi:hypothetical protein
MTAHAEPKGEGEHENQNEAQNQIRINFLHDGFSANEVASQLLKKRGVPTRNCKHGGW